MQLYLYRQFGGINAIGFTHTFIRNPLRYLRMNVVRWALPFLPAKRTAKNSTVKPIELLRILKIQLSLQRTTLGCYKQD